MVINEAALDDVARVIWHASRADEGTISATGARVVARALFAEFTLTPCPGCSLGLRLERGHPTVRHVACGTEIPADKPDTLDPPGYTPSLFE